jgi:hypothetical protein
VDGGEARTIVLASGAMGSFSRNPTRS